MLLSGIFALLGNVFFLTSYVKNKSSFPLPLDPEREKQVIEKVCGLTKEEYQPSMAVIYQCIMDESKKLQEK